MNWQVHEGLNSDRVDAGIASTEVIQHTFYTSGIDALPALQPELAAIVLALLEAPPA